MQRFVALSNRLSVSAVPDCCNLRKRTLARTLAGWLTGLVPDLNLRLCADGRGVVGLGALPALKLRWPDRYAQSIARMRL